MWTTFKLFILLTLTTFTFSLPVTYHHQQSEVIAAAAATEYSTVSPSMTAYGLCSPQTSANGRRQSGQNCDLVYAIEKIRAQQRRSPSSSSSSPSSSLSFTSSFSSSTTTFTQFISECISSLFASVTVVIATVKSLFLMDRATLKFELVRWYQNTRSSLLSSEMNTTKMFWLLGDLDIVFFGYLLARKLSQRLKGRDGHDSAIPADLNEKGLQ